MVAIMKPLCASDLAALNAIAAAGRAGLTREEVRTVLGGPTQDAAVRSFTRRVRARAIDLRITFAGIADGVPTYRYSLAGAEAAPAAAQPRSVAREVSGELGLGATPGARVSVAWVSFIDGVRA